jgi:RND family efflux transporter MFP subunit
MQRILWITQFASALLLLVAGCSPAPAATPIPTVALDSPGATETSRVQASALAVPAQEARLSFAISGMVTEVTVKAGDRVQAGQALVQLDTTQMEYDITAAEAALKSAQLQAQIERQRRKRFNGDKLAFEYVSAAGELIAAADSRAEESRLAVEVAKASLTQGTLLAPMAGTVVQVEISPGEYVQPAQVVITLVDLDHLQIETTDLSELDVAALEPGQPASVHVAALGQDFPGTVAAISPLSETAGGDVVFKVTVQLDGQPEDLLWGMSADVEINVE